VTSYSTPKAEEIEISLLGPGIGESVVVHLGSGDWMVVDSCRGRGSATSAPLEYLEEVGVDVGRQVKLVVATHAHSDHIKGIADLFDRCEAAQFVFPRASESRDFLTLLQLDEMAEQEPRAYDEFAKVLDTLTSRSKVLGRTPKIGAQEGSLLFRRAATPGRAGAEVLGLAPSEAAVERAIQEFGHWRDLLGQNPGRVRTGDPNTYCAVLWITVGEVNILVGADLLTGPGSDCGWNGVLLSPFRPEGKASYFQVPHHGAPNAHHSQVWEEMLEQDVLATLTPYWGGQRPRPQPSDQQRICALTSRAFITCKPDLPTQPNLVRTDAAHLRAIATNVRFRTGFIGRITARRPPVGIAEWEVALVAPARDFCA
jgi:hypothetical protein